MKFRISSLFVALCFLGINFSYASVHVEDYGATANDPSDDTQAIQNAIAALNKSGDTLVFGSGRYDIGGPNPNHLYDPSANNRILNFLNCDNLLIQGNGTTLLGRNWGTVFSFSNCDQVRLENVTIDWRTNNSPHSAGFVLAKGQENGNDYFDMSIEFPSVARQQLPADRIAELYPYGPSPSRPAYGGYFIQNDGQPKTKVQPGNVMRVYVAANRIGQIQVGHRVAVFHKKHSANVTQYLNCSQVELDGLNIYGGVGLGIIAVGCTDFSVHETQVMPDGHDGAFVSSTAAASRFISCRGNLSVTNSKFFNTGDDGINIQTEYFELAGVDFTNQTITIEREGGGQLPVYRRPRIGDLMEIGATLTDLTAKGTAFVTSISDLGGGQYQLGLDQAPPVGTQVGQLTINMNAMPSQVTIDYLACKANRGRGIIFRGENATITNSSFAFISGPGIQLGPEAGVYWEGPAVKNVTIDNCVFSRCNLGHSSLGGMLTLAAPLPLATGPTPSGLIDQVRISNSRFLGGAAPYPDKNGVALSNTNVVTLENNTFDPDIEDRIVLGNSITRNIKVNAETFPATLPFIAHVIPGIIEAEDFDLGGEGNAWFDQTPGSITGLYRPNDDVDVFSDDGAGYETRSMQFNEWLTYTVDVPTTGNYILAITTGKRPQRMKYRVYNDQLETLAALDTIPGNNNVFTRNYPVHMSQGTHQLRFWVDLGGFVLDKMELSAATSSKWTEEDELQQLQVWPQPAAESIEMDWPGGGELPFQLVDMQGRVHLKGERRPGKISIAGLSPGIYLLEVGEMLVKVMVKP